MGPLRAFRLLGGRRLEQLCLSSCLLVLVWGISPPVWAKDGCARFFQAKQFQQAATCYLQRERELKPKANDDIALRRDRLLRNAAFSFHHAAKQTTSIEQQGYLRDQAVQALVRSFQQGYCEASDRCRANRSLADRFRKLIGMASLAIVTGDAKARVVIKGYRLRKLAKGDLTTELPPGRYEVVIWGADSKRRHQLVLQPRQSMTLDASKARIKVITKRVRIASQTPVWVYVGYIAGGAVLATGIGFLGFGLAEQGRLNVLLSDPIKARTITDAEYRVQSASASAFRVSGLVMGAAGLVGILGAVIIQVTARRSRKQLPPLSPTVPSSAMPMHGRKLSTTPLELPPFHVGRLSGRGQ